MEQELYYVYILRSLSNPKRYYMGRSEQPSTRLAEHNSGKSPHTKEYRPWQIKNLIAFSNKEKALTFERYLKTRSGRAFAKKRL